MRGKKGNPLKLFRRRKKSMQVEKKLAKRGRELQSCRAAKEINLRKGKEWESWQRAGSNPLKLIHIRVACSAHWSAQIKPL